jgi:hypothetical protein
MIKIIAVEPIDNYSLRIELSNGKEGVFDVSPYLNKGIFEELKNPGYFRLVKTHFGGITWPNQQDFSADTVAFEMIPEN